MATLRISPILLVYHRLNRIHSHHALQELFPFRWFQNQRYPFHILPFILSHTLFVTKYRVQKRLSIPYNIGTLMSSMVYAYLSWCKIILINFFFIFDNEFIRTLLLWLKKISEHIKPTHCSCNTNGVFQYSWIYNSTNSLNFNGVVVPLRSDPYMAFFRYIFIIYQSYSFFMFTLTAYW